MNEVEMIREGQIIYTYLHLAVARTNNRFNESKSICIAYETVTDDNGRLPLLAPMSAVATECLFKPEHIVWKKIKRAEAY